MSGVCPTPPVRTRNTFDDTPPAADTFNLEVPDPLFNTCEGATYTDITEAPRPDGEEITIESCCTVPGPQGPQGDPGQGFPAGGLEGQHLAKASDTDYDTVWVNPALGDMVWVGIWDTGIDYLEGDWITWNANSYLCTNDHASDSTNEPSPYSDYDPGGVNWLLYSTGEEPSIMDGLFNGVFDWIKDIGNWGISDWLLALAGGTGLVLVGSQLLDMFTQDPIGDGEAGSSYDGDLLYTGAFTPPTLPEVVARICDWVGVTNYDTSLLPATEINMTIGQFSPARNILQMLSQVYFFSMVDSGGTLKFIPLEGLSSVKSLSIGDDFGYVVEGQELSAPYTIKRLQGTDLPRSVSITYFSETTGHNEFVQHATLETFTEGQDIKISVPITMTEQEAYDVCEKTIVNAQVGRTTTSFTSTYRNIELEPGDIITETEKLGDLRIIRIDEDREVGLLTFVCEDASFSTDTYTPSGIPAEAAPVYTDTPVTIGYSAGLIIELPPLDSSDAEQRLTFAPHGYGLDGWTGCNIYYSIDDGASFNLFTSAMTEATWGKVAVVTPTVTNPRVWDDATTITVELKTGTLSSRTKTDVLNHVNWCLIGEEIIGFQNATFISGTTYELSGLLRGRRGTGPFMDEHVVNEAFILLDESLVEFPYPIDAKETIFQFKFVTIGSDISKATAYTAQPSQKSRRPWQVSDLDGIRTGNEWNVTWTERNQFNGELTDSGPVEHPDGFGGYVIQILNYPTDDTVKRSITKQTMEYQYTEAMQTADFGGPVGNIKVRVSQIDRLVGPGYDNTQVF